MIKFDKYGYKNKSAFLKATGVARETFDAMIQDDWKPYAKSVLLHPECPLDIREDFAKDPIWYKRVVAIFATKGPQEYWRNAATDPDKRIQRFYKRTLEWFEKNAKELA